MSRSPWDIRRPVSATNSLTRREAVFAITPVAMQPRTVQITHAATTAFTSWWQWAPGLVSFVLFATVWFMLSHPELVALVPLRVASWIPVYIAWARLEHEFAVAFGFASASVPAPESTGSTESPHPIRVAATSHSGAIGWLVATYFAWKHI